MKEEKDKPEKGKIGEGHAEAMFRQGLRELRGALYPESNVAQNPEYGLYGTRTPGEIAEDRRGDRPELEDEGSRKESVLEDRLREAEERRDDRGRDEKDLDRD